MSMMDYYQFNIDQVISVPGDELSSIIYIGTY